MRYTIENTVHIGKPVETFIDGIKISHVIECDTEKGYVKRCKTDKNGNIVIDRKDLVTEELSGNVTVRAMSR